MTLTGNLGYEGYQTTKGTTSPPSVRILHYGCEYFWRGYGRLLDFIAPDGFQSLFLTKEKQVGEDSMQA